MLNLFEKFDSCLENETATDNIIDFSRGDTLGDSCESLASLREDVQTLTFQKGLMQKNKKFLRIKW